MLRTLRMIENLEFGGEHGKGRVDVGTGGGEEVRLSCVRCKYYLDGKLILFDSCADSMPIWGRGSSRVCSVPYHTVKSK